MKQEPDIELTRRELELLGKISFDSMNLNEIRASIMPMVALSEILLKRQAIPNIRLRYFTDPERNPSGRGRSREQIFESNGTVGNEILAHPNFLPYLRYFVHGPDLPYDTIRTFKEATACSGYLTGSDVLDLIPTAKAAVRSLQLEPHSAAEEFYKLALECGAMPSSADALRKAIRAMRLGHSSR
jgi:hypothetical protein